MSTITVMSLLIKEAVIGAILGFFPRSCSTACRWLGPWWTTDGA